MIRIIYTLLVLCLIFSCSSASTDTIAKEEDNRNLNKIDTLSHIHKDTEDSTLNNRLIITGDFDGDGKKENLIEHYISLIDNKEINNSNIKEIDYSELVELTSKKQPQSFLLSSNKSIDTLKISSNPQLFGVLFLKNEGDINEDGNDEVSYVINWADFSNLNTYHIVTYKNKKWTELTSFPIWEWQFDNINQNEGLIKKLNKSEIECYYQNDEFMLDTMVIKLF